MSSLRLPRLFVFAVATCALFTGCAEMPTQEQAPAGDAAGAEQAYQQGDFDRAAQLFLDVSYTRPRDAAHFKLRAAEAYRENGELDQAAQALNGIKPQRMNPEESVRLSLIQAEIALSRRAPAQALQALDFNYNDPSLPQVLRVRALELRARVYAANNDPINSARTRAELDRYLAGADRAQNEQQLVATLQQASPDVLRRQAESLPPADALRPWLDQALRKSGQSLPTVVMHPNEPVGTYVPSANGTPREGYRQSHKIALLLPDDGPLRAVAQPVRDGFFAARFADTNPQRAEVYIYDSGSTPAQAVAAYQRAVGDGADRVVGPLTRDAVSALFSSGRLPVPVLALNQPEHGETPPAGSAAFGLTPDAEAAQAAEHMRERGISRAVIIAATPEWAERAALAFRAQFESKNGQILGEARVQDNDVNFSTMIAKAMTGVERTNNAPALPGTVPNPDAAMAPSDVGIFISMRPQQARLLLPQIKLAGHSDLPVFATSHIYAGDYNPGLDRDLNGVEFCDAPWLFDSAPGLPPHSTIAKNLDSARGAGGRLFAMGLDAYALLPYLEWLSQHRDSYLPGATGQLAEDGSGRIQRLLTWAQFDNGTARPVNGQLQSNSMQMSALPQ
ncbi:MAG: penicillin-binding protein activator [Rudaea sp.]